SSRPVRESRGLFRRSFLRRARRAQRRPTGRTERKPRRRREATAASLPAAACGLLRKRGPGFSRRSSWLEAGRDAWYCRLTRRAAIFKPSRQIFAPAAGPIAARHFVKYRVDFPESVA